MAKHDLSSYSVDQLKDLIKDCGMELLKRQKDLVEEAREKALAILKEYGVMVDEVMKIPGRVRASRKKAAPKYRNPKNPQQTWAGRGRKPRWLEVELKKKGAKLESFLIK